MTERPADYIIQPEPTLARQTFWESVLETTVNIASGFVVSYLVLLYLIPAIWPEVDPGYTAVFGITVVFTITSFLRSLIWRRFFNAEIHKVVHKLVMRIIL